MKRPPKVAVEQLALAEEVLSSDLGPKTGYPLVFVILFRFYRKNTIN
jgi:hypothetical protein